MINKLNLANYTSLFPFVLYYQGNYKQSPTRGIINIIEKHFEPQIKKTNLKSLIYLLIESLQNIERYSAHIVSSEDFSLVYSDGQFFYILTQNAINNDKIEELKNRLDTISVQNKEELDESFIRTLSSDVGTEKGAGLGLIDIARKSKNSLVYSFDKKTDEYSIYKLGFSIPMDKNENEKSIKILNTETFLTLLKENFNINKSTLCYGGDFSNSFIKALITLLVNTKTNDINSVNKKTHHILIELIQNVQKHSYKSDDEGVQQLTLEWKELGMQISTYNFLLEPQTKKISKKIDFLNSLNREELSQFSKKQLEDFTQIDGIGLIDVSNLIFPEKIKYLINKKSTFVNELILTVTVNYES